MAKPSSFELFNSAPKASGLYDPSLDKDSCGLAMVATTSGIASHDIIDTGLEALRNLEHRGAVGSDADTGDGAGILTQIPHEFFQNVTDFALPEIGSYGAGLVFLKQNYSVDAFLDKFSEIASRKDLEVLGIREVPVNTDVLGKSALAAMPNIIQIFVSSKSGELGIELERKLYFLRKVAEKELPCYFPSLSCRTIVYKGMLTTMQLEPFYSDLSNTLYKSKLALVHSRFSTNTFPSWPLAHPFRMIAHNGEINTIKGNRNWMRARESRLESKNLPFLDEIRPILTPGASDSASFDEVLELLVLSGRSLPHAMMMMIPEAWEKQIDSPQEIRDFYEYHSMLIEPWDGPASVVFSDGEIVGGTLDRNGLRPGRYIITSDGLVVLASEIGVINIDPKRIVSKGRLRPGRMFLVDTTKGEIIDDAQIKQDLAKMEPWGKWLAENRINLSEVPDREHVAYTKRSVARRQRTFGYTEEELRLILAPMAKTGQEPIGAMGSDTPIAALRQTPRSLFDYFTQQFAQVTNPPLDAIREDIVTSLSVGIGPEQNLLEATPESARMVVLDFPVLTNDQIAKIKNAASSGLGKSHIARGLYRVDEGHLALEIRISEILNEIDEAIAENANFIVISDRDSNRELAPIPSLLLTSVIHNHLIRTGNRTKVGLVVEAGDVLEVHHVAALIGYGAAAINPYLAMESVELMVRNGDLTGVTVAEAVENLIYALGKGVLKVMSKMGISTVASYSGAQCFEAVGLSSNFVEQYFTGTITRLEGVGIEAIAQLIADRHTSAYPVESAVRPHENLDIGGEYQWRREGPPHLFNPETVFKLQHATKTKSYQIFKEYTDLVDNQSAKLLKLRGLMRIREDLRNPIPIEQVEPVTEIVKRFATGAMSLGSISPEAHETLAIAMNRLGGKSNTGEGGESIERLLDPERRSSIKQVASGRFGVTSMYLTHADDIQIKMAQGAKPGEGGQLPPNKVYPWIAKTRYSTPGVGLISPPPHHDIYSIEDLKQLIFDLKRANPKARLSVKLVSQIGVGTVAAGVAKAKSDVILISGHDGGTGASPLSSLKHAGLPWEIGLAETQQTLLSNGLRERVTIQVDGQLLTGRDVIIAALLGAEEFGFASAPLVVSGCVMMRVCHLDTCPVGVATQNPDLRARFTGQAEHIVNFFTFIAEQVREYLALLGFRTLDEAIGQSQLLDSSEAIDLWGTSGLDITPIFKTVSDHEGPRRRISSQVHEVESHFDNQVIQQIENSLSEGHPAHLELEISNTAQAVGTLLGHQVTKRWGENGLPAETINLRLVGSAGQSFGAFVPAGVKLELIGDANDYLAKGLSGGIVSVCPPQGAGFVAEESVIAGNVVGYGATSGEIYVNGLVGERFLIRNSGATAVAEGVGDHALEYMTGGTAVILGETGRNLAAGMSGGTAYVYKLRRELLNQDSLNSGELDLLELGHGDRDLLKGILSRHVDVTGSHLAKKILDNWMQEASNFTKILPTNFAKVTEIQAEELANGGSLDSSAVWKKILEVSTRG